MKSVQLTILFAFSFHLFGVSDSSKFNRLVCQVLNPEVGEIKLCHIKAINRTHNEINITFKTLRILTKVQVKFRILKLERGGWHPFLYAMTVDACDFLQQPYKNLIPKLIYSYIKKYTNVNHTCPYKSDTELILSQWQLMDEVLLTKYPVDPGEYGLHTSWYTEDKIFLQINGSVKFRV